MVKSFLELRIGDKVTYTGDDLYEDLVPDKEYYVCNKSVDPGIGVYLSDSASKLLPYIAFVTVEEYIEFNSREAR